MPSDEKTYESKSTFSLCDSGIQHVTRLVLKTAFDCAGRACTVFVVILVAVSLAYHLFEYGLDSTDKSTWSRSGLSLYTDRATGQQYVGNGHGLTPRLPESLRILTDKETGLQYLSDGSGGLTLRLGPDGRPMRKPTQLPP